MSASNLTDIVKSLINSTINNSLSGPVTTWETRLLANWQQLFSSSLGSVLCIPIICVSIFSKHITGDYK
uniref:Uncharacterized protein n=1 Tax=Plectus sambesii TaxID=2011161 RepID=A0A914UL83_9BILA